MLLQPGARKFKPIYPKCKKTRRNLPTLGTNCYPALLANIRVAWKKLAKDTRCSLFC